MPFLLFLNAQIFWQAPTLDSVALAAFREKDLHRALFYARLAQTVAPTPERRWRLCVLGVVTRKATYPEAARRRPGSCGKTCGRRGPRWRCAGPTG